jgi:hypothetical protein
VQSPGPPGKPPPGAGGVFRQGSKGGYYAFTCSRQEIAASSQDGGSVAYHNRNCQAFFCQGEEWLSWKK